MVAELQQVIRFHPDALVLPGDPDRLRDGAQKLEDFHTELTNLGKRLREADAPQETRGPTVRAMSRVGGTLGQVLEADADQLTQLVELARRQADRLTEAEGTLEETRRRWRQARQDLRDQIGDLNERALREHREAERERVERRERAERERKERKGGDGGGGGDHDHGRPEPEPQPTEAAQLIRMADQQVLNQVDGPLRRLAGLEFTDRHGSVAMLSDGKADQIVERYRQAVQSAFDDLVEALRSVNRVDNQLVELLPRSEKAIANAAVQGPNDQPAPDLTKVSRPDDIATVGEELQECARALNELSERLPEIRVAIREGRLTPEDERIGSMGGFQRTWKEHLDEVREDLRHARKAGDDIARELRELDERGARDVRRTFRQG